MALNIVDINTNFVGITGVFTGQSTPLFLGEKDKSLLIPTPGSGAIGIGFDTRISPTQVRVFFDKGTAIIPGTGPVQYYGLVVTREFRFDGLPIRPGIYSPAIEFQDAYSEFQPSPVFHFGKENPISPAFAIDMMSPDLLHGKSIGNPYFAYNAIIYTNGLTLEDTLTTLAPNGFFATLPPGHLDNMPLCASLIAPIGLDLDGLSISLVEERLRYFKKQEIDPLATYQAFTATELQQGTWLGKILTTLKITTASVLRLQMIGEYPLLTLDDDEGFYPSLLIDPKTQSIYGLEINELDSLRRQATSDLFERFIDFYNANIRFDTKFPSRYGHFTRSYGQSEMTETMLSGGDHWVSCTYKVYAVGIGTKTGSTGAEQIYNCLGGVEWKVRRDFEKASEFNQMTISQPTELPLLDVINYNQELTAISSGTGKGKHLLALSRYLAALSSDKAGGQDQRQWFITYSPLTPDITSF